MRIRMTINTNNRDIMECSPGNPGLQSCGLVGFLRHTPRHLHCCQGKPGFNFLITSQFSVELFQLTTIKVFISIITAPCMTTIIITIIVINILILKWYQYCNIILMTKYLSIILRPWSLWSWSWSHHHVEKALSIKFGINVTVVPALSFYLCCCLDCCSAIVVIGFQTGAKLFGTQLSWAQFAQNQNMNL